MIGQLIGQYRITQKLGEGGMGAVYKAVDTMIEREVAIKMLRAEIARQPDLLQRFRAEATTVARLNHAGIATLYNFMQFGENFFMVMEYVPGKTLEDVEREQGALPWQIAVPLFERILDAIQPAHESGILHRDIKPANIMLTTWGAIKVMDFGIARMLGTARMTREGAMVGTLEYIPPERVKGRESDARGDIYSLGVVLFEMLGGRLPFQSDSEYELMRCHLQDALPSFQEIHVDVPREIENAVRRATAKAPEERFESCDDFAEALRAASGNLMIDKRAIIQLVGATTVQQLGTAGHGTPASSSVPRMDGFAEGICGPEAQSTSSVAREDSGRARRSLRSKIAAPVAFLRNHWKAASVAAVILSIAAGLLIGLAARRGSQPGTTTAIEHAQPAASIPAPSPSTAVAPVIPPPGDAPMPAGEPTVSQPQPIGQPAVFSPSHESDKPAPQKKPKDLHSEALKALNQ